ncbi:hypothetical protein [Candidatus Sulfurimonas baltica]|uniref:Uncharacterized protein n=1 Tax=Candidatus Sulfurimonas baltica TaxID=2740404 RepID=A0A7S7LXV4_9BACT|nr:hypothetical protein [Candidatus Sulfurimonas baltica]QOY52609.1 hypothetical protein HUE88_02670 [Candidatus Sulfurimonas baltica]
MVGLYIQDNEGGKFVLTKGDSDEYPDLKQCDNQGELKSLKQDREAKDTAKRLYQEITGNMYPANGSNTHKVLKHLFSKVIGE